VSAARFATPHRWTDAELDAARLAAIANFIAARMAEGTAAYQAAFAAASVSVARLFAATADLTTFGSGAALAADPALVDAARYVAGPPISADDLAVIADVSRTPTRVDARAAAQIAQVISLGLDAERFPWLFANPPRPPSAAERDVALRWTAGLLAVQRTATLRRGESARRQEETVQALLRDIGFREVDRRRIDRIGDLAPGEFCPEAIVAGVKCDVPIGLRNGRYLLIECKVSSSAVNSVKRLNHECGDKARRWEVAFGAQASTTAVLAGVFRLVNLTQAQNEQGIALFWERDLAPLAAFLRAAI
jgi:hypothetical protein